MNSFFASAPLSQCNRFPYTCFQLSLQTLPLEMLIFPWLCPGARGPPPTLPSALGIHLSLPLVPIKCNTHGVATQPPRRLVGTADTHCACAEIGYPQRSQTSEELPRSFRPGLGSPELPGSQERLAGKSPRARGFLGQVVAALARLDFEQALDSPGLHVPHSQPCAPVGALSSGGPRAEWAGWLLAPTRPSGLWRLPGVVVPAVRPASAVGEGGAAGGPGGLAARVGARAASTAAAATASSARAVRCCAGRARRGRRGRHGARLGD